jgi:hypothetical protein
MFADLAFDMELDDEVFQNQSVMHGAWSESEYSADCTLDRLHFHEQKCPIIE